MKNPLIYIVMLAVVLCWCGVRGAEWQLAEGVQVRTADVKRGRELLTARDAFIERMSPFDRMVRMKTDQPVTEEQFLRHVGEFVLEFTPEEQQKLDAIFNSLKTKFATWNLPWPETVWLVKTSGEEDSNAAYCRGPAVILPANVLAQTSSELESLLIHELFHVLSNQNPEWRRQLYEIVGFQPCPEVEYPANLKPIRITNPDAPRTDYFTEVERDGKPCRVIPILYSSRPKYDPQSGQTLFAYLTFRLMVVQQDGEQWKPAEDENGEPILLEANKTPSYFERIGRNTGYIIHAEEVLADNFVLLIQGKKNPPTPKILEQLTELLQKKAS